MWACALRARLEGSPDLSIQPGHSALLSQSGVLDGTKRLLVFAWRCLPLLEVFSRELDQPEMLQHLLLLELRVTAREVDVVKLDLRDVITRFRGSSR